MGWLLTRLLRWLLCRLLGWLLSGLLGRLLGRLLTRLLRRILGWDGCDFGQHDGGSRGQHTQALRRLLCWWMTRSGRELG